MKHKRPVYVLIVLMVLAPIVSYQLGRIHERRAKPISTLIRTIHKEREARARSTEHLRGRIAQARLETSGALASRDYYKGKKEKGDPRTEPVVDVH